MEAANPTFATGAARVRHTDFKVIEPTRKSGKRAEHPATAVETVNKLCAGGTIKIARFMLAASVCANGAAGASDRKGSRCFVFFFLAGFSVLCDDGESIGKKNKTVSTSNSG